MRSGGGHCPILSSSTDNSTMLQIQVLFEESLSHGQQGSLITQTCSPVETWKLKREETVGKDPGMLEDL